MFVNFISIQQLHFLRSARAHFSQSASHLLALLADALCRSIIRLFGEYLCESTLLFSALLNSYSSIPIPPAWRWSGNYLRSTSNISLFVAYPLPLTLTPRASSLLCFTRNPDIIVKRLEMERVIARPIGVMA